MIDCSHGNAQKRWQQQPLVMNDVANQIVKGNRSIRALLIESHLHAGSQVLAGSGSDLRYGVSITDECMDWATTEQSLLTIRHRLRQILPERLHVPRSPGRARRAAVASVVLHEGSADNESWS
jgi:3-deoxy-7-phosphoheptulonate synthase